MIPDGEDGGAIVITLSGSCCRLATDNTHHRLIWCRRRCRVAIRTPAGLRVDDVRARRVVVSCVPACAAGRASSFVPVCAAGASRQVGRGKGAPFWVPGACNSHGRCLARGGARGAVDGQWLPWPGLGRRRDGRAPCSREPAGRVVQRAAAERSAVAEGSLAGSSWRSCHGMCAVPRQRGVPRWVRSCDPGTQQASGVVGRKGTG